MAQDVALQGLPPLREMFPDFNASNHPAPSSYTPATTITPYHPQPAPTAAEEQVWRNWWKHRHGVTMPEQFPQPPPHFGRFSANPYYDDPADWPVREYENAQVSMSDIRKHICPQCHKRFNRPSSLKIHLSTHTGDKPFDCPWPNCGRVFNVSSNMRRHYRAHLAEQRHLDQQEEEQRARREHMGLQQTVAIPVNSSAASSRTFDRPPLPREPDSLSGTFKLRPVQW